MDKRFQVFISSTFHDLQDERQAVLKAVLELDHMPAGMELFPASDETAWQLIKDVIDRSDYYLLIIGGRYGSLDEKGIGYTEKEYDYAVSTGKPVIALLHRKPDNLPRGKTETDPAAWAKLERFRKKVESSHTCVYWENAAELKAYAITGITTAIKRHPAVGWVRADEVPSATTLKDVLMLKQQVEGLKGQLESERRRPPPGTEDLRQADDEFEFSFTFDAHVPNDYGHRQDQTYSATLLVTWNQIFAHVAPSLINEAPDSKVKESLRALFQSLVVAAFEDHEVTKDRTMMGFKFDDQELDTCIVQLRALGLIQESLRKRSLKDTRTYWSLTKYGDDQMVRLRALRRHAEPSHGHQSVASEASETPLALRIAPDTASK